MSRVPSRGAGITLDYVPVLYLPKRIPLQSRNRNFQTRLYEPLHCVNLSGFFTICSNNETTRALPLFISNI